MGLNLGSSAALFRVGSGSPSKAFLGTVSIQNVPGAPAIDGAGVIGGSTGVNVFSGTDDGGSPITSYEFTFDDVPVVPATVSGLNFTFTANYGGQDARVRAVNAVGPGPYSEPALVG